MDAEPAIWTILGPADTNIYGTILGGTILSYIDIAGAFEAKKHTKNKVVTAAMKEVAFKEPIHVSERIGFFTKTLRVGRTSVTVKVEVFVDRDNGRVKVTEAELVFVSVNDEGHPVPVKSEP
jgi:acyl-CoA thioesterase YciA